MKNKLFIFINLFFLNFFICLNANSIEQFNFDVTEIEILEKGNLIKGLKKGKITTDDNVIINANTFIYKKNKNILEASGDVEIIDNENNLKILSDNIIYLKNKERIITNGNSKAINNKGLIISAKVFDYKKNENILVARTDVIIENWFVNFNSSIFCYKFLFF